MPRFPENKYLTNDLSEETPAVVLGTSESGGGRAMQCGCHPTAEAFWVDAFNKLILRVPAVSVQRLLG